MLLQEERQRTLHIWPKQQVESSVMLASRKNRSPSSPFITKKQLEPTPSNGCGHYGRTNHIIDRCWLLHGALRQTDVVSVGAQIILSIVDGYFMANQTRMKIVIFSMLNDHHKCRMVSIKNIHVLTYTRQVYRGCCLLSSNKSSFLMLVTFLPYPHWLLLMNNTKNYCP